MSQRANLIKCEGLVTHGSELSVREGSLRQATNVNIDEDGVITPRRGFNDYGNPTGTELEDKKVKQLFEYKDRLFRHYEDQLQFEDETGNFKDILGSFLEVREGYRIKWQESKGNMYFTTEEGIKRISLLNNKSLSSTSTVNIEQAGVPKAAYMEGIDEEAVDGFLKPQSKVAYRFIFGRKDANNNLLLGSPSSRHIVTNTEDKTVVYEKYIINISQDFDLGDDSYYIDDGDYIVVSSLNAKITFYFKTSSKLVNPPQNAQTLGSSFVEVDISSTRNQISEPQYDQSLLYKTTNRVTKDLKIYECIDNITDNFDPDQIPGANTNQDYWIEIERTPSELISGPISENNNEVAGILASYMSSFLEQYEVDSDGASGITITSKEEGDIEDLYIKNNIQGPIDPSTNEPFESMTYTKENDGSVDKGLNKNCKLTLIIPNNITTDYFVQLYRTPVITKPEDIEGIELNDLDPGDECNLVFEVNLTQENIDNGFIEIVDDYPESFRASSTSLYTNEITGEGILQANDPPPIALDIDLFRGSMFYANTRLSHRLELTFISVNDFLDLKTRFILGNSTKTRYYTASVDENLEGPTDSGANFILSQSGSTAQSIDQTVRSLVKVINQDTKSLVNAYYLSGPDDIPGKILLEARDLTDDNFYVSLESGSDKFVSGDVYIEGAYVSYNNNDYVCLQDTDGSQEPSGDSTDTDWWEYINFGAEINPELPKSNPIVRLTGTNTSTKITVEGHDIGFSLNDAIFVSYLDDGSESTESFSGIFTIISEPNEIGTTIDPLTEIEINYELDNSIDLDESFLEYTSYFSPTVESDNLEVQNRLYFSKVSEPEAVPNINYIDVGAKDEEILRILALRDNLFVMKGDGIYIVSGTSAPNFSVRLLDNTRILAPDSAVVLNNQIYALTEQGVTVITDSGAGIISKNVENLIDDIINSKYNYIPNTFGVAYENDRAYLLFAPSEDEDTSATQAYRYNIFERNWSKWEYNATCGHVMERDNKLYLGNGDINYISQERKNFDRTDICDRDFDVAVASRGVSGTEIDISTTDNIEVNDVIVQVQQVSVNYVNRRLLRKMDLLDTGLELSGPSPSLTNPVQFNTPYPHLLEDGSTWTFKLIYDNNGEQVMALEDYEITVINDYKFSIDFDNTQSSLQYADLRDFYVRTFSVETGDFMPEKLQKIHDYLSSRDNTILQKNYTLENMRENVEYLVDALNDSNSITLLKDYKKPEDVQFEAYITEVNSRDNFIYSHTERPFLQQPITIYKNINKNIEWNPQHFGDPSALKQVRTVSIIFDQNNFYGGKAKFASDVVQALTEVNVRGKGIAYWGDLDYDDLNAYWGGEGNDVPFRTVVPREKQRCRYLTVQFEHRNAREEFRILGISGVVRAISERGYR